MSKSVNLISGPIDSSLRKFALPLAFSFLIQNLYTWVDMYYVSRLSPTAIAALKVCEQLIFFLFSIASGFAVGSGVVVARRIGEGNKSKANHTATQSLLLMLFIAIALAIAFYFFSPFILNLMNIKGEVLILSIQYLSMIVFGIPANFLIFHINAIVRAAGNSVFPMTILITANILNAIIAPFLIFGLGPFPRMEIYGAGLATAIAQNLGFFIALFFILKKFAPIELELKSLKIDYEIFKKIFKIGVPATLQLIAVSVNRIMLTSIANMFGVIILTTYMFGLGVDLFVFMSIFAVGAAIEIITGQNLGANKIDRVFQYHKSSIKQLSFLMVVLIILVFLAGEHFTSIFISDPALIKEIVIYLRITVFTYVPFAIGIVSLRVISGSGDYNRSLRIVLFIFFGVQLPLCYVLSIYTPLSYLGIWYGILVSQIVFALLSLRILYKRKWISTKI
ncbi:MAG: MATE family efflux transporter [Candidatus Kapabacteria bacterium]|nr:MATE family efflux transporter [Candidatus Kapabacteria bacterium]